MRKTASALIATRRIALAVALGIVVCAAAPSGDALPRRGLLGVSTVDAPGGVTISAVIPSLPGEAAGLRRNDFIVSVDGALVGTVAQFLTKLRRPAGQPVSLGILRDGKRMTVHAVLSEATRRKAIPRSIRATTPSRSTTACGARS